jgi:hypothetical protein
VRSVGWLAWLLPIGFLLKVIGWPIILVLSVLAAPVLILLFIIGLPIFAVILVGGLLMSLVGVLLTVGITLLKFAIPVLLIYWVVRWLWWKPAPISAAPAPQ